MKKKSSLISTGLLSIALVINFSLFDTISILDSIFQKLGMKKRVESVRTPTLRSEIDPNPKPPYPPPGGGGD